MEQNSMDMVVATETETKMRFAATKSIN